MTTTLDHSIPISCTVWFLSVSEKDALFNKGEVCASFHSSPEQNVPMMCCLLYLSRTRYYNGEL